MGAVILLSAALALVATLPFAHMIAALVTWSIRVNPGHIREVMPVMPAARPIKGRAERRWDRQVHQAEARLLRRFKDGVQGAEASALAPLITLDPMVVEEALARMREEIPCRLRVTRQGRMLHDFKAEDVAALRRRRALSMPLRAALFGLALFANLGAAWPVLAMALGAVLTLAAMAGAAEEEAFVTGLIGLSLLGVFFVVNLVAGLVVHLLLTPPIKGPSLGDLKEGEAPRKRTRGALADATPSTGGSSWGWIGFPSSSSSSSSSSSKSSGGSGGGGGGDSDLGSAIIVIILLVVIAVCLVVVVLWMRGLWRSVTRKDEEGLLSPTQWVREADVIDWSERYIPTNDLVLRAFRALWRVYSHRRPQDPDMGARALLRARRGGGVVSALELSLSEGIEMAEAAEVGARLCGMVEGEILVSDEGDLAFSFPEHTLAGLEGDLDDDLEAEYVTFNDEGRPRRRSNQPTDAVPVNVVGLTRGHLVATDRLVAGTFTMAVMGILALQGMSGLGALGVVLQGFGSAALVVMAAGTATLSALCRYTARSVAAQGVLRDGRRALVFRIRRALEAGERHADLRPVSRWVASAFSGAWAVPVELVEREIATLAADLGLEPIALSGSDEGAAIVYDVTALRRRLGRLQRPHLESAFGSASEGGEGEEDGVIFDTEIVHERVSALA